MLWNAINSFQTETGLKLWLLHFPENVPWKVSCLLEVLFYPNKNQMQPDISSSLMHRKKTFLHL